MGDIVDLDTEIVRRLLAEFQDFKAEMSEFRTEMREFRTETRARFVAVDARFAEVNARLDAVNGRIDHLVDFFGTQWRAQDRRLHKVERAVDALKPSQP